jgi:hypothetical protein
MCNPRGVTVRMGPSEAASTSFAWSQLVTSETGGVQVIVQWCFKLAGLLHHTESARILALLQGFLPRRASASHCARFKWTFHLVGFSKFDSTTRLCMLNQRSATFLQ